MKNEKGGIWKEVVVTCVKYYVGIQLRRLRKTM